MEDIVDYGCFSQYPASLLKAFLQSTNNLASHYSQLQRNIKHE